MRPQREDADAGTGARDALAPAAEIRVQRLWCSYYNEFMAPRNAVITFRPDADIHAAMTALREQEGVPFSQQIRRALRVWLESKGAMKADRKRAATRKRP